MSRFSYTSQSTFYTSLPSSVTTPSFFSSIVNVPPVEYTNISLLITTRCYTYITNAAEIRQINIAPVVWRTLFPS